MRISRPPNQMVFAVLKSREVAGVWCLVSPWWNDVNTPVVVVSASEHALYCVVLTKTDTNCIINCNLFFCRCR